MRVMCEGVRYEGVRGLVVCCVSLLQHKTERMVMWGIGNRPLPVAWADLHSIPLNL